MGNNAGNIEVKNLYKIFGSKPLEALELHKGGADKDEILQRTRNVVGVSNASFKVDAGEIGVVMGLSGSGKSTLVRCLNRLIEPTAGEIIVDGVDVVGLSKKELLQFRRSHFGMVFQHFALFPHRTVLSNTEFGLEVQGVDKSLRHAKAMESLSLVGLKGYENSYPGQLSGGMQQRVGLARALTMNPSVLLMDEAFSALDPLIRTEMQDELIQLQRRMKKTVIFITHDLDEALKLGDKILLMKDGVIVQQGTGEEILTNPANPYVRKFVENVDMAKVVTAGKVMAHPKAVAYSADGPHVILHKMEELELEIIFALDENYKLVGYHNVESLTRALEAGGETAFQHVIREVPIITEDVVLHQLFKKMASFPHRLPIVSQTGELRGQVGRERLLAALSDVGAFEATPEDRTEVAANG